MKVFETARNDYRSNLITKLHVFLNSNTVPFERLYELWNLTWNGKCLKIHLNGKVVVEYSVNKQCLHEDISHRNPIPNKLFNN